MVFLEEIFKSFECFLPFSSHPNYFVVMIPGNDVYVWLFHFRTDRKGPSMKSKEQGSFVLSMDTSCKKQDGKGACEMNKN